ncbi:hypothetical protein NEMIN01_0670 [Nematocida minor]|uniref:uncharacterized protein n=1 Tax=Nematocida minor TaxID=1912983 RepID=UPI0022210233|nr:uncharacterized protein NEMIN01_0670 [Nematocida minor]KAI5189717.1 hypothetical protein NEMIN01_0670 [Nematocida minor]
MENVTKIPLDTICVYRIDIKKAFSSLFASVYGKPGFVFRSLGIRMFEAGMILVLLIFGVCRILSSLLAIPVYQQELKGFQGKYGSPFEFTTAAQHDDNDRLTARLLELAEDPENTGIKMKSLVEGLLYEKELDQSKISMSEYVENNCSSNNKTLVMSIVSAAVNVLFFIRASGICTNLFNAIGDTKSFVISLFLILHVMVHIFIFTIFMILTFDENGRITAAFAVMIMDFITMGFSSFFGPIGSSAIGMVFSICQSPLVLNVLFSSFGILLHRLINISIEKRISPEASEIIDAFGAGAYSKVLALDNEQLTKDFVDRVKSVVGSGSALSEVKIMDVCRSTIGNFTVFMLSCFFSYVIIYELDKTVIYYFLLWAPDIAPFRKIRKMMTVRLMIIFKLLSYVGVLVSIWFLFKKNPM